MSASAMFAPLVAPLAGVAVSDRALGVANTPQAAHLSTGSARWPFALEGLAQTQVAVFFQAARVLGIAVPEALLFQAGEIFYHDSQTVEVRLSGLLPGPPAATGQPTFTPWQTRTPPALTLSPEGRLVLAPADQHRPHFAGMVMPESPGSGPMIVACIWNFRPLPLVVPPFLPLGHEDYFAVLNPAHYHAVRESLAHNTFGPVAETPWPTAPIATGPARGVVQLRPITLDVQDWMSPEETDHWVARMWQQRQELSDLDADALDMLCGLWLTQARTPQDDAVADVDALLTMRGLQAKQGGTGRRGGYDPAQREAMLRAVLHVQSLWVHLNTLEVYPSTGRRPPRRQRRPVEETVYSRVFTITDVVGHQRPDGFMHVEKFVFRPGKVFAHFLFGAGRQTALLATQALSYDPVQHTWEKRLARYLSYQWRCKAHAGDVFQPFSVASLLAAVGHALDHRHPMRTRARLEKALERLLHDRLIAAWQYERWDESCTAQRGWAALWRQATIRIEPPDIIREHYQTIARRAGSVAPDLQAPMTLGERLQQRRQHLGLTLLQVAEQLGVSPSYLHRLEHGHRGKHLAAKLQKRLETWLTTPPGGTAAPPDSTSPVL